MKKIIYSLALLSFVSSFVSASQQDIEELETQVQRLVEKAENTILNKEKLLEEAHNIGAEYGVLGGTKAFVDYYIEQAENAMMRKERFLKRAYSITGNRQATLLNYYLGKAEYAKTNRREFLEKAHNIGAEYGVLDGTVALVEYHENLAEHHKKPVARSEFNSLKATLAARHLQKANALRSKFGLSAAETETP